MIKPLQKTILKVQKKFRQQPFAGETSPNLQSGLGRAGQTFVEYTLLIGIVIAILLALTPMIKQSSQAMVKTIADEVGYQQGAEQGAVFSQLNPGEVLATKSDGIVKSVVSTQFNRVQRRQEWNPDGENGHGIAVHYKEKTTTGTVSGSNLGLIKKE